MNYHLTVLLLTMRLYLCRFPILPCDCPYRLTMRLYLCRFLILPCDCQYRLMTMHP